jgi:hypothetical protein
MVVIHYKKFAFYWLKFFAVIFFILGYFYLTYLLGHFVNWPNIVALPSASNPYIGIFKNLEYFLDGLIVESIFLMIFYIIYAIYIKIYIYMVNEKIIEIKK